MAELFTKDDVLRALRMECRAAGSVQAWSDLNGIPTRYVNEVLNGSRPLWSSVAAALGFRKVDRWEEVHPDG